MLHTINQSPFRNNTLKTCIRFVQDNDPVLFIEDGVYAVQDKNAFNETIKNLVKTNPVYVLGPDLKARGINNIVSDVKSIDYDGFVGLVEEHQVNSWL